MKIALEYLTSKDKILAEIIENFGDPIIQKREEGFASMCHIILEQQVSIASAKACYEKISNHFGKVTPISINNATEDELRKCGVSRQKIIYLKHLAKKVIDNQINFESFASKSEDEIRAELIKLKGIGNWSIEVYLMFCLQTPDIIPLGDIAIKNTLKELYNCKTKEEMEVISNSWKPYRTLASFIVWHYYLKKRNRI
ncbi:DNA-3-methyladenine glycosylase family protein [Flavobacterium capsici]|uniref:DNA-3-methyladenine glycosylase II n=1 Tax=Flavobacterium capsici TaxID=3075618 RepID=A0AA96J906_9FLAO|nr:MULTISPECIES: DNA-3-methyladenine glycosylase 2 family protein [unclassified Flavobacterium]WNM20009.1 DNA-3-methyladenine glycosylase 2 family protein [Flavobacterium sp. PMR2A8]WNM21398.1 DNA-3-methyladenine glycosylase 2 family protein [Flavobacterium sp. PMTSA4]